MFSLARRVARFFRNAAERELGVADAYARWAVSYPPEAHNAFMRLEQQAVLDLLPDVADRSVLDAACGTGRYLGIVRARGAAAVLGFDLSIDMLQRARALTSSLARADLSAIPFRSGAFDVIICGLAVGHVRDLQPAVAEMSRVLAPGGVVVYSDMHPFARLAGGQRSFDVGGRAYTVEHHLHLYAQHHDACRAAGLAIDGVREPPRPGGGDNVPAVLAVRARKPA